MIWIKCLSSSGSNKYFAIIFGKTIMADTTSINAVTKEIITVISENLPIDILKTNGVSINAKKLIMTNQKN